MPRAGRFGVAAAAIEEPLRATLRLLRKLTREHAADADDIRAVLAAGVSRAQIRDALAVCFAFNTMDRLADTFEFFVPGQGAFEAGAKFLLKRGTTTRRREQSLGRWADARSTLKTGKLAPKECAHDAAAPYCRFTDFPRRPLVCSGGAAATPNCADDALLGSENSDPNDPNQRQ
jgi:hypothetical protein